MTEVLFYHLENQPLERVIQGDSRYRWSAYWYIHNPAEVVRYGETLTVETRVERIGRTSFAMVHRVTAPESRYGPARLIATADSTLVSYDYTDERPIPVPQEWRAAMAAFEGRTFA